jgi:hypothetical protein
MVPGLPFVLTSQGVSLFHSQCSRPWTTPRTTLHCPEVFRSSLPSGTGDSGSVHFCYISFVGWPFMCVETSSIGISASNPSDLNRDDCRFPFLLVNEVLAQQPNWLRYRSRTYIHPRILPKQCGLPYTNTQTTFHPRNICLILWGIGWSQHTAPHARCARAVECNSVDAICRLKERRGSWKASVRSYLAPV